MVKTIAILILAGTLSYSLTSCKESQKTKQATTSVQTQTSLNVDSLLQVAEQKVNDTIVLQGKVKHTCSNSGRRCFITDPSGETTLRVEASGNIKGFNKKLVGSEIQVTGIVKEQRLSQEYIDNWEKKIKEKEEEGEHCDSESNNITQMREWMKKNNKDFYSIYYLQGIDYEIVK